jgi:CubicO group peptidase (beta-lactamase class C family)
MTTTVRRLLAASLAFVLFPASLPGQSSADSLMGIWASETVFEGSLRGELVVRREGSAWRAMLAGAESRFAPAGDSVRFAFPGGGGAFRGALAAGGAIEGFWLQPAGAVEDREDPGGSGQPFATPLVLRRAGDAWRGTVRPLEGRFTLYLRIFRDEQGTLAGAFRNPEINSRGRASQFRVTRQGDSVWFSVRPDTTRPEIRLGAELVRTPDRLRIFWGDMGRTLELVRRTPAEAAAFFPRPPGEPPYAYRPPPETGDGWRTARAAEVGIDEAALAGVVQGVIDGDPAARRPNLIHSLLVARRGRLVLEEYFFGHARDTPHDMRSAGKTFGSVMLGAAMRGGAPLSADSRIYEVLAGMGPFTHPDARKARITLAHLMTHTTGLACNDNDDESPGNEGTMQRQRAQPDWWKYTLDLPMAHDPGTRYAYCSANSNLVGAALTVGTRTWLPELFRRTVAEPLQFGPWYWNLMPTGEGYLGGGAFLRPRDLLKIGQAFLDGGVWNGRRIVDSAWVALSTAPYAEISPATTGLSPDEFGNFYGQGMDAYAWHLSSFTSGGRGYPTYQATGNGGQVLIVVPELELVVVFTGGNYMQGGIWGRWGQGIVGDRIIPAIRQ